jgi:hypothetical protein
VCGIPVSMLKLYVGKVYVCLVIPVSLSLWFHMFSPYGCCVCLRPDSYLCFSVTDLAIYTSSINKVRVCM